MSEMTVGCIRTTVTPQQSGIYGALLEKAERDAAELANRLSGLELSTAKQLAELERERDEARKLARWFYTRLKQVCLDHPLEMGGILARLEEAVLDDPWLEAAK